MPKTSNKQFHIVAEARATGGRKGEVTVYSSIGRYKWDEDDPTVTSTDFDKKLKALGDVDEITVRINSPGGVVTEAVAIRTALMKHPAKKTVDIEGCCDSAATLIACLPGARVRMAQGGDYMIHRCSAVGWGHADDILALYNSMTHTDNDMAAIYAERTGMTEAECLDLMTAETWYGAKEAMEAGFVDEIIPAADDEAEIAACAVDAETMELMRSCYAHAPEHTIISNEQSAVAAEHSTENTDEGVTNVDELKNATAEQLQAENPALMQDIAQKAVAAERERMQRIDRLTPKGAKFAELAKKAKEEGTSVEDYLAQVIEAQDKEGAEYLEARKKETASAEHVGGGDSGDNDDDKEARADKAAKEIAEMAKEMRADNAGMA